MFTFGRTTDEEFAAMSECTVAEVELAFTKVGLFLTDGGQAGVLLYTPHYPAVCPGAACQKPEMAKVVPTHMMIFGALEEDGVSKKLPIYFRCRAMERFGCWVRAEIREQHKLAGNEDAFTPTNISADIPLTTLNPW